METAYLTGNKKIKTIPLSMIREQATEMEQIMETVNHHLTTEIQETEMKNHHLNVNPLGNLNLPLLINDQM